MNTDICFVAKSRHCRDRLRLQSRASLLAATALTGAAFTVYGPISAAAQELPSGCAVTSGGTVNCSGTFPTTNTTNTNGSVANSTDRIQLFNNGSNINATIQPGTSITGFGLTLTQNTAGGTVSLNNQGSVTTNQNNFNAIEIDGNGGTISYSGNSSSSAITTGGTGFFAGLAIFNNNNGDVNIGTAAAPATGTFSGRDGIYVGVPANSENTFNGNQNIFLSGGSVTETASATTTTSGGAALFGDARSGTGNVFIQTTGNTTIGGTTTGFGIIAATLSGNATIITDANIGTAGAPLGTGILAAVASGAGSVNVNQTGGAIFATITGISAQANGSGNVTVQTAAGSAITMVPSEGNAGVGISAVSNTGNTSVTGLGTITAGTGIFAGSNTGQVNVAAAGKVTATSGDGIHAATGGAGTITVANSGAITGAINGIEIDGNGGTVSYSGNGSAISTGVSSTPGVVFAGLAIYNNGNGNVNIGTAASPVTGTFSGQQGIYVGIPANSENTFNGNQNIFLSGGSVTETSSAGGALFGDARSGTGNVFIQTTGNTTIAGTPTGFGIAAQTLSGSATIITDANIGTAAAPLGTGILATVASGAGSVNVNQTGGAIFATITGINAQANGSGNVTVQTAAGSAITMVPSEGNAGVGISAVSNTGNVTVTTGGNISAGTGIAIATGGSGSAVVTNTGTISGALSLLGTGTNAFNNNGTGTWNTSGTSSFAGTSVINNNGGTISLSGSTTLVGLGSFTINNNGAINVNGAATTQNLQSFTNSTNGTLTINGGGSFTTAAPVTNNGVITVGGALLASAGITNNSGATIRVNASGTVTDTLANSGTVTNGGTYNADVSNASPGIITNNNIWNGNLLSNTGTVANSGTGTWTGNANNNGGTLNNSGVWNGSVANAGTFGNSLSGTVTGSLTNTAGIATNAGTINGGATVTGGVLTTTGTISGGLTNSATVNASGTINGGIFNNSGTFNVVGPLTANGAFTNASGASLLVGANAINNITTLTNGGTISLGSGSAGGTIGAGTVNNNGVISVSGNSVINGAVNNAGTISFTGPSQSLTTGNFTSSPGSSIALLGSASQGSLDRLIVNGTASGTVALNLSGVTGICPSTPASVIQTGGGSLRVTSANGPAGCTVVPIAGGIGLVSLPSVVAAATVNRSTTQIEQTISIGIEQHIQQIRDQIDYRRRLASTGSNPPLAYADDNSSNDLMSYASTQPRDAASGAPAMFTKALPTASPPPSYGVWLQGFGDIDTRSIPGFEHTTYTAGVLGGVDKTWFSLLGADDALVLGLVSNYATANVNYSTSDLRVNINGPGIGGYGTYLKGAFSVDATAKVDIFDISTISSEAIPNSATLYNYSLAGNTQYKFDITKNIFFEPTVGFIYTYSQYADVAVAGVFNNGYDWRAQAGGRVGSWFDWNGIHFSSSLQALAYDDVKITGTTLQTVGLVAPSDEGKTRGQIDGVLDMDYGHGLSSYLRGEIRFGEDLFAYAFKGGMRYQW
jgi:fibronectin-binding autotransporter adhesin